MSSVSRYPKQVFWSDEDEGFIAVAPDLPGSSAFGETEQEALSELDEAIVAWIEAAEEAGNPVPKPSQPAIEERYSGKFVVRVPKSLHAQLVRGARDEGVSLNHHINVLLSAASALSMVEKAARTSAMIVVDAVKSVRFFAHDLRRQTTGSVFRQSRFEYVEPSRWARQGELQPIVVKALDQPHR